MYHHLRQSVKDRQHIKLKTPQDDKDKTLLVNINYIFVDITNDNSRSCRVINRLCLLSLTFVIKSLALDSNKCSNFN